MWAIVGSFLFTLIVSSGKFVGSDISAIQIIFFRYLGGFLTMALLLQLKHANFVALAEKSRDAAFTHLSRTFCGAFGIVLSLNAATQMPLADANALGMLRVLFTTFLAVILLRERANFLQIGGTIVSVAGAIIVARANVQAGAASTSILPIAGAISGAFLIACELVLIKRLSARDSGEAMILIANGLGALVLLVPAALVWSSPPWEAVPLLLFIGPLAIAAQSANIRAYRLADASFVAPFGYASLLFSLLIGWLVFSEAPSAQRLLGALLIVCGGLIIFASKQRNKTQ